MRYDNDELEKEIEKLKEKHYKRVRAIIITLMISNVVISTIGVIFFMWSLIR